jgi:hypothetical protein
MPTLADAATAGSSTPAAASSSPHASVALPKAQPGMRTVLAPATVSHYAHVAPRAGQAATDPNPDLAVQWDGGYTSALGVNLTATVSGYTTPTSEGLSATVDWGDGTTTDYSNINTTSPDFSHVYASTGVYSLTVTISDGEGDSASDTWGELQTEGSEYTPYVPTRLLDTRKGIGAPAKPVAAKGIVQLKVGNPPIPEPYGITAVVLNVTVTDASANGFLSVYGDDDLGGTPTPLPKTSNINFLTGQNIADLVIVPVGTNGIVDFYNGSPKGTVDAIADVEGYFSLTEVNKFVNIAPTRILDTRKGIGTGGAVAQVPANGNLTLTVPGAGNGAIPTTGNTSAVAMNLTAVGGTRNGVITAYPAGESLPTVSNLNYGAGQTTANMTMVPLGTNGQIVLHNNSSGPVDLIADADGYFTSSNVAGSNAYVPEYTPNRDFDSRPNPLPTGAPYSLPASVQWASSMVYNATVTDTSGNGFLSLYPYDPNTPNAVPGTSNLNYLKGQTKSNLSIAPIGTVPDTSFDPPFYDVGIYLGGQGSSDVILDAFGFFADQ